MGFKREVFKKCFILGKNLAGVSLENTFDNVLL